MGYDIMYKNYPERKKEHIDRLNKNILKRWETVKCELSPVFGLENSFISIAKYQNISKHQDFNFAVEHIKKYPCWKVWKRIMESVNSLNSSASEILNEIRNDLNEAIDNGLNSELSTSDIKIYPLPKILDQVVQILIADSDKKRRCDEHISVEVQDKWVQVKDTGSILAEGGSMQDLEAFKQIICGLLLKGYLQKKMRKLLVQFKDLKKDENIFTDQLRVISSIAENRQRVKGMCAACPRFLWFFSP